MNKKGFTLIELLAVIVILSIISLIATPIVLNIISDARSETAKRSVELFKKALQDKVATLYMNSPELDLQGYYTTSDGYKIVSISDPNKWTTIDYTGDKVVCDKIQLDKKGNVNVSKCKVGNNSEYVDTSKNGNKSCFGINEETDAVTGETYGIITGYDVSCGTNIEIPDVEYTTDTILGEFDTDNCMMLTNDSNVCSTNKSIYDNKETTNSSYNTIVELFVKKTYKETDKLVNIKKISSFAFLNKGLTNVILPNSIVSIEAAAFAFNDNITSLEIPNSIETIGASAFYNNKLQVINIPDNVKSIGEEAFSGNNITSINIGSGITSIGPKAFKDNNISNITLHKNYNNLTSDEKTNLYKNNQFSGYSGNITWNDGLHSIND